jgi:enoyl-CoA hydratase/carnithine racemase
MIKFDPSTDRRPASWHRGANRLTSGFLDERDYSRRCENRYVAATEMDCRVGFGDSRRNLGPYPNLVFHTPNVDHTRDRTRPVHKKYRRSMQLDRNGNVFILRMDDGENRLNDRWLADFNDALNTVEAEPGPKALVTTGAGRFYSNGLDLEWLTTTEGLDMRRFVADAEKVLARILAFPAITVAALNGHTFAAGAMLALAHDFRIMREDRGFFCLPEVDIKIPFTDGMNGLVMQRMPTTTAHQVMVTGGRFAGPDCVQMGIIHSAVGEHLVVPAAVELAASLADKDPTTLGEIKQRMYAETIYALTNSTGTAPPGM